MSTAVAYPARLLFRPQPEWMTRAACKGLATPTCDPWHPQGRNGVDVNLAYATARRVCASCPVRLECLADGLYLLETADVKGMWGGHTPHELRALARRLKMPARKKAQHGTRARYVTGCRCPDCAYANALGEHQRRTAV